jgi:hypothetical protein
VDEAPHLTPGPFDLVFTTWGTICWLPDITVWARVIASVLVPGGVADAARVRIFGPPEYAAAGSGVPGADERRHCRGMAGAGLFGSSIGSRRLSPLCARCESPGAPSPDPLPMLQSDS